MLLIDFFFNLYYNKYIKEERKNNMNNMIENFRDGIFALHTRRFGTVAELMIQKLYHLEDSKTLKFDKKDNYKRIEVKFSRGLKENTDTIKFNNVIQQCIEASTVYRTLNSFEASLQNFDCNIQQIKNKEFDILYYGIFFKDHIEIFKIESDQINKLNNYSDKQHRGNVGEGQFHLNNTNIEWHRNNYLINIITYAELYQLFL